ncbi:hypothetical protein B0H11DRAFT_1980327 [Mycena galericulata]|nr:hypothetical protein B0H11DRAFT_1980327 [Mycena galericulata]
MRIPFFNKLLLDFSAGGGNGGGSVGSGSHLPPRKGGGSVSGKTSSGKSSSSSNTGKSSKSTSGKSSLGKGSTTRYGNGGGKTITIPSGQLFAGRTEGGGTRSQIWGSRRYGSGYPGYGYYDTGVSNRPFPFFFWPVVWGPGYNPYAPYIYNNEYGQPGNNTRPGGPQATAVFHSNSTNATMTIFHVISDNATVASLMSDISANCSAWLVTSSITNSTTALPTPSNTTLQKPEQVVQYYRASSVTLMLDGYNNTAIFAPANTTADVALPAGIDLQLSECLNATIGRAVPLVDSGLAKMPAQGVVTLLVLAVFLVRATVLY